MGLEASDIFGKGVGIHYNQRQFHKTKLGGTITLIIFGILLFQSFSIVEELVEQANPSVIQQTNYVYSQDTFQITPKSFIIALGLQDSNYRHFFNERVYFAKAYQYIITRNENATSGNDDSVIIKQELQVERCTQNHFQIEDSKNYFLHLPYSDMYCLSLHNQNAPFIQGEFSANKFASVEIQFHQCIGQGCVDETTMNNFLSRPTLAVYFSDMSIDVKNRDNPFISTGKNLFWTTGQTMEKDIFLSLINTKIVSDFSILSSTSGDLKSAIVYSSDKEMALPATSDQLFTFTIAFEKNKEVVYNRNYLKIGNAFSQVGGLFNFLVAVGFLFFRQYSQNDLNRKLITDVFDIKDDQETKFTLQEVDEPEAKFQGFIINEQNKKLKQKCKKIKKLYGDKALNNSDTPNFKTDDQKKERKKDKEHSFNGSVNLKACHDSKKECQSDNISINLDHPKQENKSPIKEVKFSLWTYLCNVWRCWKCCVTTESNLIQFATNQIFDHIDLFNVIKKLIEVDKLKQLLLNEDQIQLFEYLPKPVLFMTDFQPNKFTYSSSSKEIEEPKGSSSNLSTKENHKKISLETLKKSYFNIVKQRHKTVLDYKIVNMLDPIIKNQIEDSSFNINPNFIPQNLNIGSSIFRPRSHQLCEFNDLYEDQISKVDEINDNNCTQQIKTSQVKQLSSLKNTQMKFKLSQSVCESMRFTNDTSKQHINN